MSKLLGENLITKLEDQEPEKITALHKKLLRKKYQ